MAQGDISLEPLFNARYGLTVLEGYAISDQETGATSYYGYINRDGEWYIQKAVITGSVVNYTYKKGSSGYSWAGRAGGTYASFDVTF